MANFNFDFEKYYRPILEQSEAVGSATNQLTGFQQGQGTAMMDLQKMMQEVSGGYKKAQEAKTAAVQAVAGGSGQYAQALPDTINPMARQQLAQGRWAQDVAQMSGANETLAGLREGDQDRLSNAMQFRNAEEARLAGAVQAQKDRYTMLQNEYDRSYAQAMDQYNMETEAENTAWNRNMETAKLNRMGSPAPRTVTVTDPKTGQTYQVDADTYYTVNNKEGEPPVDEADTVWNNLLATSSVDLGDNVLTPAGKQILKDRTWATLMQETYQPGGVDKEQLWARWQGMFGDGTQDSQQPITLNRPEPIQLYVKNGKPQTNSFNSFGVDLPRYKSFGSI